MKQIDKFIVGSVITASVIGINYNISTADKIEHDTYVTTNRLNMRKGPSTDYALIGTLNKGEKVVPIAKSSDGLWVKINYNSKEAWVSFAYLQKEKSQDTDIKEDSQYQTTANLNMRKGPSTDYAKVATIPMGTKVTPSEISSDGKWVKVKYNNQTGWIIIDYIKPVQTTTPTDPKPTKPNKVEVGKIYQITANLNMRKGSSTDYAKIATIPMGTKVTPSEISSDGKWVKVTYNNQIGWIIVDYMELVQTSTPTEPNKVEVGKTYQTTMNVNARKGPSSDYEVVTVLKKGTKVEPVEIVKAGYWAKFKYDDQFIYVCTTYLEPSKSETTGDKDDPTKPDEVQTKKLSGTYETSANLSLRKGPGTNYGRYLVIPEKSEVEASEITLDKQWIKVTYKNQTGWVKAEYLDEVNGGEEYYTTTNLNFRVGASTNSSKICQIPKNSKVILIDFNSNGLWAKVIYQGKTGWVSSKYLTNQPLKQDTYWEGTTTENLRIRKGPSTAYSTITTIPKNSKLKVYDEQSGWLKVKYNSYEGYCLALYVK